MMMGDQGTKTEGSNNLNTIRIFMTLINVGYRRIPVSRPPTKASSLPILEKRGILIMYYYNPFISSETHRKAAVYGRNGYIAPEVFTRAELHPTYSRTDGSRLSLSIRHDCLDPGPHRVKQEVGIKIRLVSHTCPHINSNESVTE